MSGVAEEKSVTSLEGERWCVCADDKVGPHITHIVVYLRACLPPLYPACMHHDGVG